MKKNSGLARLIIPVLITVFLGGMYLHYLDIIDEKHATIIDDINNGRAAVLSPDCSKTTLAEIIFNNGYAETQADADFIADTLVSRQQNIGRLSSLYTLQKRAFGQVPASALIVGTDTLFAERYKISLEKLGQDSAATAFSQNHTAFAFSHDAIKPGNGKITVRVYQKVDSETWWKKIMKMKDEVPSVGVPVRLMTYFRDSIGDPTWDNLGFLTTDSEGVVVFDQLDTEASFSVLPIMSGYEYGIARGTVGGEWKSKKGDNCLEFNFEEKEHRIQLFGNATLRQIKSAKTIMVRSPQEFRKEAVKWFIIVLAAWWVVIFTMLAKKKRFDGALVGACMFLTGLCVLMMFSMQDPLNDELNGVTMAQGVLAGLIGCFILQFIDFVKFYQDRYLVGFDFMTNIVQWVFKPYRQKIVRFTNIVQGDGNMLKKFLVLPVLLLTLPFLIMEIPGIRQMNDWIYKQLLKIPKGFGWIAMALILTMLLWIPGLGQSVGGMLVNLKIGSFTFQPSEIAKYLILFFTAAYFTQRADTIITYSQPNRLSYFGSKLKTLMWIIIGLAVLMAMYLKLGDMGPGLVLGVTFILVYSLIKSKVDTDNISENDKWKRIFTCDFAMLVYGVLSFAALLIVGKMLNMLWVGALLWFVAFALFCRAKKQLFESALLMVLVIFMFVFGGEILSSLDNEAGERFNQRISMCTNTWGHIDLDHINPDDLTVEADPVSNTQVVHGLWALATGGMRGQGFGNGKPSLIPAFHTDMILSSIGEQTGWIGLLLVVLALTILLNRMAITGYRTGHPFAFYLCMGFAIVTAVQFFIIALGSTGVIPLTGVTVPFLSYGRVSMILNLTAFGVVLSLSGNYKEQESTVSQSVRRKAVQQYGYPFAMLTMVFMVFAIATLLVWQQYQLWSRDKTLVRQAFVLNNQGAPIIEHNPRIDLLVSNMYAGRIFDRNGRILATSDPDDISVNEFAQYGLSQEEQNKLRNVLRRNQKRFYPFSNHLFFMVGDQNEGLMYAYDEYHPAGYMAEVQHLSYLRNFDNVLYDENHKPVKVRLHSNKLKDHNFLETQDTYSSPILVRDYSALLEYLKDGIDGKLVAKHNQAVRDSVFDLHLTIDAKLQTELQHRIAEYMNKHHNGSDNNLTRVSVVVLDAQNGDLLASANYPLPDYDRLREEEELAHRAGRPYAVYTDNQKNASWKTYTDRDLGTTYQTPPGSTAKVMSAIAGFRKLGVEVSRQTYFVTDANRIEKGIEPPGNVTMHTAIKESSNCYFVNLVQDKDLYDALKPIYSSVGINIGGITPYFYTIKNDTTWKRSYNAKINSNRVVALRKYELFRQGRLKKNPRGEYLSMGNTNMSIGEWKWAWGQGYSTKEESYDILASPLNMARVASIVVNNGKMPVTQYLMGKNNYEQGIRNDSTITIMREEEAHILKGYMLAEAAYQGYRQRVRSTGAHTTDIPSYVGSKTGTPERDRVKSVRKDRRGIALYKLEKQINDGWYILFVERNEPQHPIAVAVRMERRHGSGHAVRLVGRKNDINLLQILGNNGYLPQ